MPLTRRNLVFSAGSLAGASLLDAGAQTSAPRKPKIVVAGGHPGDPEYGCGGAIARFSDLGFPITILYLNTGDVTCPDPAHDSANVRVAEAHRACEILKARPVFAGQCDGHAIVDAAHYDSFRALIEAEQPGALFTQWPIDGHRDHRAVSLLAYDAWQSLGMRFAFYYYEVSSGEDTLMFSPTDYVDITAAEPRKRQACYAHASQTPDKYYDLQSRVARFRGLDCGYAQAEAFVRHVRSRPFLLPGRAS